MSLELMGVEVAGTRAVGLAGLRGEFVRLERAADADAAAGAAGGWGLRLEDGFAVPLASGTKLRIDAALDDRLDAGPLTAVLTRFGAVGELRCGDLRIAGGAVWTLIDGDGYWNQPAAYVGRAAAIVSE